MLAELPPGVAAVTGDESQAGNPGSSFFSSSLATVDGGSLVDAVDVAFYATDCLRSFTFALSGAT